MPEDQWGCALKPAFSIAFYFLLWLAIIPLLDLVWLIDLTVTRLMNEANPGLICGRHRSFLEHRGYTLGLEHLAQVLLILLKNDIVDILLLLLAQLDERWACIIDGLPTVCSQFSMGIAGV